TICTSGVVVQVNVDTKNIGVFHYLYFDNLLSHQLGSKCFLGGVETTTQAILKQQHIGQEWQGGEQGWLTRTTVVATSTNKLLDNLGWSCGIIDRNWVSVKSIIVCDRADLILIDLIIGDARTTIANQNSSCDFLVEHDAHLSLQPCYNIEISDVKNIISIKLLLLVDGGRIGLTLQKLNDLFLLKVTLDVASCSSFIGS